MHCSVTAQLVLELVVAYDGTSLQGGRACRGVQWWWLLVVCEWNWRRREKELKKVGVGLGSDVAEGRKRRPGLGVTMVTACWVRVR